MKPPTDTSRPFLAYGIFRPGQIAFFQLADLVRDQVDSVAISGRLFVRDGQGPCLGVEGNVRRLLEDPGRQEQ